MSQLTDLKNALMICLRVGVAVRIAMNFIKMQTDEESSAYSKKIKHGIIFYIMAELIWQFKDIAMYYWR